MNDIRREAFLPERLRVMQTIAAALTIGPLVLLGVALAVTQAGERPQAPHDPPVLTLLAGLVTVLDLIAWMIVPGVMGRQARQRLAGGAAIPPTGAGSSAADSKPTDAALLALYQTRLIVSMALIEAAALLAGVAYLMEGQQVAFFIGLFLVVLLAAQIPKRPRVETWLAKEWELIEGVKRTGAEGAVMRGVRRP
jgi:hypothetical protein